MSEVATLKLRQLELELALRECASLMRACIAAWRSRQERQAS